MDALVTGGAGFIGSHFTAALLKRGYSVRVLDNLSSGRKENLVHLFDSDNLELQVGDCTSSHDVERALQGVHTVFHFAANPEVRLEMNDPENCYRNNILATYVLMEKIRKSKVELAVLASSSTIYGEAKVVPTPEDYGPLEPISVYGASKLACEALLSSYCHSFKKRGIVLRPANIIGPRATHGVIFDFIRKLKADPSELEILGDGSQAKSYLYVDDFVNAALISLDEINRPVETYNVGSQDQITVREIAERVVGKMSLKNVRFRLTGGIDGGRAWIGDVKTMLLDTRKLRSKGWSPKLKSREAVEKTARDLISGL